VRRLILIGGAPGIGKSYLARKMGEELKLPWISTDTIREMMRKVVRKEDFPELLHFDASIEAEKYLSTHTAQQIMESQNKESLDVWKGVKAFVETDYVWKDFIVEGIAVLPEFASTLDRVKVSTKPIFLIDENQERIREVVFKRGIWDDANKYSDDVKDVEVEWVTMFNKWLRSEADKFGFDIETIRDINSTQLKIIQEAKEWLNE